MGGVLTASLPSLSVVCAGLRGLSGPGSDEMLVTPGSQIELIWVFWAIPEGAYLSLIGEAKSSQIDPQGQSFRIEKCVTLGPKKAPKMVLKAPQKEPETCLRGAQFSSPNGASEAPNFQKKDVFRVRFLPFSNMPSWP